MLRIMMSLLVLEAALAPAMAQKPRLAPPPKPHCANHSELYAPACPRLKRGYCKGDFQLCDMG